VRCGRPACPECLRAAPVGHQCVGCIAEASRETPRQGPRRAAARLGLARNGATVTYALIGLNVACYLAEWLYPPVVSRFLMVGSFPGGIGVAHGQDYRLLTSAFLHQPGLSGFGPAHIIFNMWALLLVGPALERLLGPARFLGVYLLSALGGSVLFYLLAAPAQPALGASGAIFGLFGAWFVAGRRMRVDTRGIVVVIVINLAFTFLARSVIAWQDHVGGLVTGGLLMAAYAYAPRRQRALVQVAATAAVAVLLVIAVVVRTHQLAG
jgi:membrane associated rhomboid family serine protease